MPPEHSAARSGSEAEAEGSRNVCIQWERLEAAIGIEPMNKGFAVRSELVLSNVIGHHRLVKLVVF